MKMIVASFVVLVTGLAAAPRVVPDGAPVQQANPCPNNTCPPR